MKRMLSLVSLVLVALLVLVGCGVVEPPVSPLPTPVSPLPGPDGTPQGGGSLFPVPISPVRAIMRADFKMPGPYQKAGQPLRA